MDNFKIPNSHLINTYYTHSRPEIRALVDKKAELVLDVGCGAGVLGGYLKRQGVKRVIGIEQDEKAAELAKKNIDVVWNEDIEKFKGILYLDGMDKTFDYIIFADVLEHLVDPWAVLRKFKRYLKDDGKIIASLPNVLNVEVWQSLSLGRWLYRDAGIMDRTHLRFFALDDIRNLFYSTGYDVEEINGVYNNDIKEFKEKKFKNLNIKNIFIKLDGMAEKEMEKYFAYQYLVTAKKTELKTNDKCVAIICALFNQWEYTRKFLSTGDAAFSKDQKKIIVSCLHR